MSGGRNALDKEDDVHLNYDGVAPENNKAFIGCCKAEREGDVDHQCCLDVWSYIWHNYRFGANPPRGPARECTDEETYRIDFCKVICKQITSLLLTVVVVWFAVVIAERKGGLEGYPSLFSCDPDDPNSLIAFDGVGDEFEDDGVRFCQFKSSMIFVSFIFLLPFVFETFSVLTTIWVSSINSDVLVPVVDGNYVGQDEIYDGVFSKNVVKRILATGICSCSVPLKLFQINSDTEIPVDRCTLFFEIFWKLTVLVLPDIIVTLLLFPVSYFVILSSGSPEDVLVNLVAVQIFAELDDIFVKMLLSPRASGGERVLAYVSENPNADRATYSPFQAYTLNENRHEMGIKVKNLNQMKYFHNYTGHHITG